jgi:competence protein ComEC
MEPSRKFLLALAGFLGGVALASFVVSAYAVWLLLALGAGALANRKPMMIGAGIVAIAAAVGMWRTEAAFQYVSVLAPRAGQTVTLDGYVDSDFELTANGGKFTFFVLPEGERTVVYGPEWMRPRYGQEYRLTGKLKLPTNRDDFDYVSYLAKSGIYTQLSWPTYDVPDAPLTLGLHESGMRTVGIAVRTIRDAVGASVTRAVGEPHAGYLNGILLGTRGTMLQALKDAFARTGTSHILAISGYNITIVAAALMAALSFLGRRRAFVGTLIGITLFVLMVGASASVVRAALMGILMLAAIQMGRLPHAGIAILLSAAVMCLANPLILRWDVGFQLSFLAVAGIIYLEPLLRPVVLRVVRFKPIASLVSTTLSAQIAVLPLLLYSFGTLAVYTLPVNLLVLPLVPLAMALGLVTGLAGMVWPFAGSLVGQVVWLVAAVQLGIIGWFSQLPYAALQVRIGVPMLLALYATLVAWLVAVYRGSAVATTNPQENHARTNPRTVEARRG